jgi:hypothetical protein
MIRCVFTQHVIVFPKKEERKKEKKYLGSYTLTKRDFVPLEMNFCPQQHERTRAPSLSFRKEEEEEEEER